MATDMKLQGFYLDKENEENLDRYSQDSGLSKSEIVRRALRLYLALHMEEPETADAAKRLSIRKRVPLYHVIAQALHKVVPKRYFKKGKYE